MEFFQIVVSIVMLPAFLLVMRYNMHMFQLNGYFNGEHRNWLKQKHGKQRSLLFLCVFGVLSAVFPTALPLMALLVTALVVWRYYQFLKKINTKKNIVYTHRVQRMIGADIVLAVVIAVAAVWGSGISVLPGTLAVLTALQMFVFLLINILMKPFEKMIKNRYIRDAERILAANPDLKIIGVTGSYGKTSVKFYLQTLLSSRYSVLVTPESYNTPMGVVKTIRESLRSTHEIFVCEMGARKTGEIKEICDFVHPDHGLITSIGPAHLDTFHSIDNIVKTKFELADALPEGGTLFLNGDNEYLSENSGKYPNVVFYRNHSAGAGYCAGNIHLSQKGTEFTVTAPSGETEKFQTRLLGEHNIINIAGAIAVANTFGIPLKELRVPVRRIRPVPHRMEMIERGAVTIIDDAYNSNPVGSRAAVETLKNFEGIRILITPGMVELGDREEEYNYKFGGYAADCCDYVLLIGRRHTAPIEKGLLEKGFPGERCHVYEHLRDALDFAYGIRAEGHKFILLENDLPDNY